MISASLFGALAARARCHLRGRQFEEAIDARRRRRGIESWRRSPRDLRQRRSPRRRRASQNPDVVAKPKVGPRLQALAAKIENDFPAASHDILFAGISRLADYQDEAYAADYLRWLEPIRDLDQQHGNGDYSLLRETGRYLALWMSYEDAIRVADLKIRRSRFDRVQKEVRASGEQLVRINEFLHPGPQEIADILPAGLGTLAFEVACGESEMIDEFTGGWKNRANHVAERILAALRARELAADAAKVAALSGRGRR